MVIAEGFVRDQLLLRANALAYLAVLSIVPLLALATSLLHLIGGTETFIQAAVGFFVDRFAAGSDKARDQLLGIVQDANFGALTASGGGLLVLTTILAIGNVERALNAIWGVTQQRPWVRRIPDYLAVVMISPILLGVALSMAQTFQEQWIARDLPWAQPLLDLGGPTLLVIAGFAFLYWFLPNTQVQVFSAILGSVVAGLLFAVAQRLYVGLAVGAANYNAIFGSFAVLPLLMVWVYFSCAILLLGAEVAYAHQTLPRYRREVRGAAPGPAVLERIGLSIALVIARAFRDGARPWDETALSEHLDVPLRTVREVTCALERGGILVRVSDSTREDVWQLARSAERVHVADVLAALRGPRDVAIRPPDVAAQVHAVLADVDSAEQAVVSRTLAELIGPPSVG